MIVGGTRLAGKVDENRAGFVVTRFVHIWFVPLIPLSSWFVTSAGMRSIPFSLKSVLAAYVRGFGVVAALGGLVGLVVFLLQFYGRLEIYLRGGTAVNQDEIVEGVIFIAVLAALSVGGAVAYLLTRFLNKASAARCAELSRVTGLDASPLG